MSKKNILCIGDTQFPFQHIDYLDFCAAVRDKYNCGTIIHVGDVADCLNWSRYERDPEAPSPLEEISLLKASFEDWADVFPRVRCVVGNHDNRIRSKLDSAGFPAKIFGTEQIFRQFLSLPKGWTWEPKIMINTRSGPFNFIHGDERGSSVVAGTTARKMGESVVKGHNHTQSFCHATSCNDMIRFDMNVGCGFDRESVAAKYARKDLTKSIYGCAVIEDGIPHLEYMYTKNGRWDGKI